QLQLPLRALARSAEMELMANEMLEGVGALDGMIEYHTSDDRFMTARELAVEDAEGIRSGASALAGLATTAIAGCQERCPGVAESGRCQGNMADETLVMLKLDYGEGGLD